MKKIYVIKKLIFVCSLFGLFFFFSCSDGDDGGKSPNQENNKDSSDENNPNPPGETTIPVNGIIADSYFWGTWIRMDNGKEYEFAERYVAYNGQYYENSSGNASSLSVKSLGNFNKQSESVMIYSDKQIPFFRKGGTNLDYTLKLVGFENPVRAAVSSTGKAGLKATSKSDKYTSFSNNSVSDAEGILRLKAPVAGDSQTVVIDTGNESINVKGIKINNKGDYMGTVPIVDAGSYSLKITGKIDDGYKDDGYLYGNNYKSYPLELTITNISEVKCETSYYEVESKDTVLTISGESLSGPISTLKAGMSKTIKIHVKCGGLIEPYIDTGINISVTNSNTSQKWVDFVPLRFYRGMIPITIAAKSTENNNNSALNGFIIYPDGNNQFFAVSDNEIKRIRVPTFGNSQKYKLAFSGATVSGNLSASTEMFYTVSPGTKTAMAVDIPTDSDSLKSYYNRYEPNDTEENAEFISQSFEAYLHDGDIDYFEIIADGDELLFPSDKALCTVKFDSGLISAPASIQIIENQFLYTNNLPVVSRDNYTFDGWYIGDSKIYDGYKVLSDIILKAKWIPVEFSITYNLGNGTNSENNPKSYTVEDNTIVFAAPSLTGYDFDGWYTNSDYSGEPITEIESGSSGSIEVWAKWSATTYSISYELDGGTIAEGSPSEYTIESDAITLPVPVKEGWAFGGWYESPDFSGDALFKIERGKTGNLKLYAHWCAEITAIVSVAPYSDIVITTSETENGYSFSVSGEYDSYLWIVNEIKKGSSKEFFLEKKDLAKGVYEIVVEVKGTEYYSGSVFLKIEGGE